MTTTGQSTDHTITLTAADFESTVTTSPIVLVDFWASWCGPCKSMAPVYERAAAEFETRVRLAKVNTDEQPALATRFGIRGIPTFVIFRNGKEVARTSGAMDLGRFLNWVGAQHAQ